MGGTRGRRSESGHPREGSRKRAGHKRNGAARLVKTAHIIYEYRGRSLDPGENQNSPYGVV